MNAKEANRRSRQGQAAAERHEPGLRDKYEAVLRANAKRVSRAYRATGINVDGEGVSDRKKDRGITAAGRVPTLDEVLADATLAKSATARTKVERQRIAEEAAHPIITEAGKRELRALLEPLVAAQAGVQAERIVAGVRDRVAAIMLEALTEGYSVPDTAALLQANLELDAVWQAEMLARTDLISLSNAASHAAVQSLEDGPKFKTWLSAGDNRVRPTHVDANRQTVPIDKPYKLSEGVELQYPGDPEGPDGETINCRCVSVFTDSPAPGLLHSRDGGIHDEPVTAFDAPVAAAGNPYHEPKGSRSGGRFARSPGRDVEPSMTWEQVKARHPLYGDEQKGDEWAVAELAWGGDPTWDGNIRPLSFTEELVSPSDIVFQRYPMTDARAKAILEKYQEDIALPPVLLVGRGGELLTADGHHRLSAAEKLGIPLPAVIAHSPLKDTYQGAARIGTRVPIPSIGTVAAGFDPLKHPRYKRGDERGGQFSPKAGTSTAQAQAQAEGAAQEAQHVDAEIAAPEKIGAKVGPGELEDKFINVGGDFYELGKLDDTELGMYADWADQVAFDLEGDPEFLRYATNARQVIEQRAADRLAWSTPQPGVVGNVQPMNVNSMNPVFKGELDGRQVVVKPHRSLSPTQIRNFVEPGFDLEREEAAAHVGQLLREDAPEVAPNVLSFEHHDVPGLGRSGVTPFVNGQTVALLETTFPDRVGKVIAPDIRKIRLYDAVIGNTDRHTGNIMVTYPSAEVFPIDHGLAFPSVNSEDWPALQGGPMVTQLEPSERGALERLRPRLANDPKLPTLLTADQIKAMDDRIGFMLHTDRIINTTDWQNGLEDG